MKSRGGGHHPRPGLPQVNLLSQTDLDHISARGVRTGFAVSALALVVLIGCGWLVQHQRINAAEDVVASEQAETARLSERAQELTAIKAYVAGVEAQKRTVATTMAQEVYISRVLNGVREASPGGTSLQSISVTLAPVGADLSGASAAVCPGPDPFQTELVVGCVTLAGTADSRAEVGKLVTALAERELFVEPFISTTTTGDSPGVTFSGSVALSPKVFSGRYGPIPDPAPAAAAAGASADKAAGATGGTP